MPTKDEAKKTDARKTDTRRPDSRGRGEDTPTGPNSTSARTPGRTDPQAERPGRTIESPGEPGLEKEPNRDKAFGPGGQRLTSSSKPAAREADVPGVDKPDGINAIDPNGETKAEDEKLL